MIEPLPRPVRDYLAAHRVACVFVTAGAKLGATTPGGLTRVGPVMAVWWCASRASPSRSSSRSARSIRELSSRPLRRSALLPTRLNVVLSDHSTVVARAQAAVGRLQAKLAGAQSTGDLRWFNRAYQPYRLACRQRGKGAMPYGAAVWARLPRELRCRIW